MLKIISSIVLFLGLLTFAIPSSASHLYKIKRIVNDSTMIIENEDNEKVCTSERSHTIYNWNKDDEVIITGYSMMNIYTYILHTKSNRTEPFQCH